MPNTTGATGRMTNSIDSYATLLASTAPGSVSDEPEADMLRAAINALVDKPRLTRAEEALLKTMLDLLSVWEAASDDPIPPLPPLEQLRVMMSEMGISQADLVRAAVFPNRAVASNVLAGKRALTYSFVERLAAFFHCSPAVFFPDAPRLRQRATPRSQ
jgi:HTH-type transcriptional regulator / antitoxin HigA